jgi:hypothetical protein
MFGGHLDFVNALIAGLGKSEHRGISVVTRHIQLATSALSLDRYREMLCRVVNHGEWGDEPIKLVEQFEKHFRAQFDDWRNFGEYKILSRHVFDKASILAGFENHRLSICGEQESLVLEEPFSIHIVSDDRLLGFLFFCVAQRLTAQGIFLAGNRQYYPKAFGGYLRLECYPKTVPD